MKRTVFLIAVLLSLGAFTALAQEETEEEVEPKKYAVVVGISDYPGSENDLRYTDDDAREINSLLKSQGYETKLLLDRDVTKTNIKNSMGWLQLNATKKDTVVFYFSGHGYQDRDVGIKDEKDGLDEYLVNHDYEKNGMLRDDELAEYMKDIDGTKVVVLDTCHSGGFIDGSSDLAEDGYVVITASDADEYSQESPRLENGVFTYYFLKGADGKADANNDGNMTTDELYDYADPKATGYNPDQHAQYHDGVEGDTVLITTPVKTENEPAP